MRPLIVIRRTPQIDFMRWHRFGFAFSLLLALMTAALFISEGLNYGIDFVGGTVIEARSRTGPADLSAIRAKLDALHIGQPELQRFGPPTDVMIRIPRQPGGDAAQMQAVARVRQALGNSVQYRSVEVVGPSVGGELIRAGIIATVLALLRLQFDLTTLAAILTVAGYSVNDTVVIYDRVREAMQKHRTMPFRDLINLALNETLSRTILTVSTVALAVLSLLIFGGPVLRGFSIAMLWGVVIGTYSSLFIAAPVLYYVRPKQAAATRPAAGPRARARSSS